MKKKRLWVLLISGTIATIQVIAQNADVDLLKSVNRIECKDFSNTVANSVYVVPTATTAGILLYGLIENDKKSLEQGLTIGTGLALNTAVSLGLKKLINRPRPYEAYPEIIPCNIESSASFPSAHTSMAFNFATSLSLHYPKWYIIAPAYTWAAGVGFARMNQGVHYPSDVLGGMIVGTGCAFATYYANKWLRKELWTRKKRMGAATLSYPSCF